MAIRDWQPQSYEAPAAARASSAMVTPRLALRDGERAAMIGYQAPPASQAPAASQIQPQPQVQPPLAPPARQSLSQPGQARDLPPLPSNAVELLAMTFGPGAVDQRAQDMQRKAVTLCDSYNAFFNQLPLRRGWRTANFSQEEVQPAFIAAAQVAVLIREGLDRTREEGLVLRQLEGSTADFLWGWPPGQALATDTEAERRFARGLIRATLSDANGLVEGLVEADLEGYMAGHPMLQAR